MTKWNIETCLETNSEIDIFEKNWKNLTMVEY